MFVVVVVVVVAVRVIVVATVAVAVVVAVAVAVAVALVDSVVVAAVGVVRLLWRQSKEGTWAELCFASFGGHCWRENPNGKQRFFG